MKLVYLKPIKESPKDFEPIEKRIKEILKQKLYYPVLRELGHAGPAQLQNSAGDSELKALFDALFSGRITFNRGVFSGRLNAGISKCLRGVGARFDRKTRTYKADLASLPYELRAAIASSDSRFNAKLAEIDRKLAQNLPEEIAGHLRASDIFDRTLWKTEKDFHQSVKRIQVAPELTPEQRKKIADEWETNLKLKVKDFTEKEILSLREKIKKSYFAGNRYESAVKAIQTSYGVSDGKAKFLARQETSLLMTTFKEERYKSAGIFEYTWHCVTGSKLHPVRPRHKKLADESKNGKIFRWDKPPLTSEPGQPARYNNPGRDPNCRCYARPVVRFAGESPQLQR